MGWLADLSSEGSIFPGLTRTIWEDYTALRVPEQQWCSSPSLRGSIRGRYIVGKGAGSQPPAPARIVAAGDGEEWRKASRADTSPEIPLAFI